MTDIKTRILTENGSGPVFLYITGSGMEKETDVVYKNLNESTNGNIVLCEIICEKWDDDLTPWKEEDCLKNRVFSGNAGKTLDFIKDVVLPEIDVKYPKHAEVYVAGYSLAGLFALWTLYEWDKLDGAICCSGSLWYPGWKEYVAVRQLTEGVKVYLSLGNKEPLTRHPVMNNVGTVTQYQYEILKNSSSIKTSFVWNEGGHFDNPCERIEMGINWILQERRKQQQ